MGILQSKVKKRENHPSNKDLKNRAAKRETDFNCGEGNDLTGNLNDTSDTSQGRDPTELISHQTKTSNGSETTPTRMHRVPAVDAPHSGGKTCTPEPELLQAAPATPAAGLRRGVKMSAGLHQLLDAKLSQQKSRRPAQVQKHTTAPVQQQDTTQVMQGRAQHGPAAKEAREVPPHTVTTTTPSDVGVRTSADSVHKSELSASVQVLETPVADCSFGNKEQRETVSQLPASEMQAPVHQEVVRGGTTGNLHSKKAKAGQKSNRLLSDANKDATDKPTATGIAEVPSDHSTKKKAKIQVNNEENVQHKRSFNHSSVTNVTAAAVEGNSTKRQNEPQQIPQSNKGDADGSTSSCAQNVKVKAAAAPPATVVEADAPNNSAMHNLKTSAPQDTDVKPKKKCSFKALNQEKKKNSRKGPTEEEKSDQAEKEKQDTGITCTSVTFKHRALAEGRWHPFTVNPSCSRKARCKHNPDSGLPPNVQKWFDEPPNYLREPPWVTTARLSALREVEEEGGDHHQ